MKKSILSVLVVCLMATVILFTGCSTNLKNSPTSTSNMNVVGDVLVYEDYIYFANAFKEYSTIESNGNDVGKVETEALYRVKTTNGEIEYDEQGCAQNVEQVVSKIVGSEHTFLYSIDEYIYFASPNAHKDIESKDKFEYSTYFKIKTDGTGLKELYTTKNEVSTQSVLNIENKYYLVFVDGTQLKKIELSSKNNKVETLAENFNQVVFAKTYKQNGDRYAYFTTNLEEEKIDQGLSGVYLYKIDIITGEKNLINAQSWLNQEITPISVIDGNFYFTMKSNNSLTYYYSYSSGSFSTSTVISPAIDNITVSNFTTLSVNNNSGTSQIYYIFSVSTTNVKKVYCFKGVSKDYSEENCLINKDATILFTYGEYVYYSVAEEGIYRVSVKDKVPQTISDMTDFKTNNICFDGRYVYFYAKNADNTTGTYYLYRADTRNAELGNPCNVKLVGFLNEDDLPQQEE